jgi:hypothetical protein
VYRDEVADITDWVGRLSCHDLTALLALVGLTAELIAVIRILRSVGVGDSASAWIARTRGRIRARVRRLFRLPVPVDSEPLTLRWGDEMDLADEVSYVKGRPTDLPPPENLAEVGDLLNTINLNLNELDQKIIDRENHVKEQLNRQVARLHAEITSQTGELDAQVQREIEERVKGRKAEGALFSVGVLLQGLGAVVLLVVC